MITKQVTRTTLYFDNPDECYEYQNIYKAKGCEITRYGSEDYWFFECEKEE